ncbi:hypothetical protein RUM44_013097 [Polyplax serrata]|uniref:Uncharacterized protein n=1 Tax=Polyplax serrata TaxID=468196 RepID=A0ABR1BD66_POLSC
MVRKLKFHEKKLLKKVDFIAWEVDNNLHEIKIMKRFHIQKREDYTLYNKIAREVRDLARKIKLLNAKDPFRIDCSAKLLEKCYILGLIPSKWDLSLCDKITASSFCRRRLPVIMVKSKMVENLQAANEIIEQGHVRVGPELVKDPAFLVTRHLEDFITWVDTSTIRKHILNYNQERDDYAI